METNINIIRNLPKYSSVQNPIPMMLNIEMDTEFISNYMVNTYVVYNERFVDIINPINDTSSEVLFNDNINDIYKEGDSIFLYCGNGLIESGNEYINGVYTILSITSSTSFIIDFAYTAPFPINNTVIVFKYFKYKNKPDRDNNIRYDFHSTLKDFLGSGLLPDSPNEMKTIGKDSIKYGVIIGEEYNYTFNFDDNYYDAGKLGFVDSSYTSVSQLPFKIGDEVNVSQIVQEWQYTDNQFINGSLGFISTNIHNFTPGDLVYVSGQITHPSYNGYATVIEVPDQYTIVLDKSFVTASPTEGGKIFGNPVPQYSGNTKIIDIKYVSGVGVVITVDKDHNESTQPISGKINLISNKKFGNVVSYQSFMVRENLYDFYYSFHNRFDNKFLLNENKNHIELFDYYVVNSNEDIITYRPSTILNHFNSIKTYKKIDNIIRYRISENINSSLLRCIYSFYDIDGNLIGQSYKTEYFDELSDVFHTGLEYFQENNYLIDIAPFDFDSSYNLIKSYSMGLYLYNIDEEEYEKVTTDLYFKDETTCSNLPNSYSLTWLDSNGSYISYPFDYLPNITTDVKRKDYYIQNTNSKNSGAYTYDVNMRGNNNYFNSSSDSMKLTSGWLSDKENILFEDLIRSTDVYLTVIDNKTNHKYTVPVTLDDKNITYKTNYSGDMIFNYTPTVTMANNDYRFNNYTEAIRKYINDLI